MPLLSNDEALKGFSCRVVRTFPAAPKKKPGREVRVESTKEEEVEETKQTIAKYMVQCKREDISASFGSHESAQDL